MSEPRDVDDLMGFPGNARADAMLNDDALWANYNGVDDGGWDKDGNPTFKPSYCALCGVFLAGGMIGRSESDPSRCCECDP